MTPNLGQDAYPVIEDAVVLAPANPQGRYATTRSGAGRGSGASRPSCLADRFGRQPRNPVAVGNALMRPSPPP
jgi:hypothetical protein